MERVDVDDLEPDTVAGAERWRVGDALGTADVAVNRYRLAPGEGLPSGLHAHADQEEVFLVLAGAVTFERYDPSGVAPTAGEVTVRAGEAVRFPPGEFQSGRTDGDEPCVLLALGAPRDSVDVRIPFSCPDCGHDDLRLDTDDAVTFGCPACGAGHVPAPCPDCGGEELGATLGDAGDPVVECGGCGTQYADPPLR